MILKVYDEEDKTWVLFEGNLIRKLKKVPSVTNLNIITKKALYNKKEIYHIESGNNTVATIITNCFCEIYNSSNNQIQIN